MTYSTQESLRLILGNNVNVSEVLVANLSSQSLFLTVSLLQYAVV
jgi:hypothetical protein